MIIGLCGLAGSGKSEVAKILRDQANFERIAFADPLKSMLAAVGLTYAQLYGGQKEAVIADLGVSPRHLMQTLGSEWGRDLIHPDIWVKFWARKVHASKNHVVVDDVRFANEVETIKNLGGYVWRVDRPGLKGTAHQSEAHAWELPADLTIFNEDGLLDLRDRAMRALHRILPRES